MISKIIISDGGDEQESIYYKLKTNDMNKVILCGNLGKDVEVIGNALKLSVATSSNIKKGDEWEQKTEWHNVVITKRSEWLEENLTKGAKVLIDGKLTYSKKDDKYYTNIIGNVTVIGAEAKKAVKETQKDFAEDGLPF